MVKIYYACIFVIQSTMTFQLVAMDAQQEYVVRLQQSIQDREHQIKKNRIIRYTIEFATPFLAYTIDQPYAAGMMAVGVAAICLLTNDIEDSLEVQDVLKKELYATLLSGVHYN